MEVQCVMIHELQICTSTNDLALASDAPQHGETWIAYAQTQGRGRRHQGQRRVWFSPSDGGVYFSIVLLPECEVADISGLSLVVGAALCEALRAFDISCWLKWPNDIYVGSRKLAGILSEASSKKNKIERIVIGVGININIGVEDIPEKLKGVLTSMSIENKASFSPKEIALSARENILNWADFFFENGFSSLYHRVLEFDESKNLEVQLENGKVGISQGIMASGKLGVRSHDGELLEVNSGELRFKFS